MLRSIEMDSIDQQLAMNIKQRNKQQKINRRIRYLKQSQIQLAKKEKKEIYGRFFNYDIIKFNKQKKYMMQQEKNTEIQRQNRVLFEKLQTIKRRSQQRINKIQNSIQVSQKSLKSRIPTQSYDSIKSSKIQLPILPNKIILFQGKRFIDSEICNVIIFTNHNNYIISVERGMVQQKIQIPLSQYKIFLRQTLRGKHQNIFHYLSINQLGYLELKGVNQRQTQVIEHGQLKISNNRQ